MSKRKHKNRPRKQPSKQPQQIPVKPEEATAGHTRRNILIGLGGATVTGGVLGLIKFLSRKEAPLKLKERKYQGPPKDLLSRPKLEGEANEYEKWASTIKLPQVELGEPLNLSREEKIDYFLPKNLDRKNLDSFYDYFDQLIDYLQNSLKDAKTAEERKKIISIFLSSIVNIFHEDFKEPRGKGMFRVNFGEFFNEVNRVLIPHNYWIRDGQSEAGFKFIVYETNNIRLLSCKHGGQKVKVPVVFMKPKLNLLPDPESERANILGNYNYEGNYITVDEEAATDVENLRRFNKFYRNSVPIENEDTLSLNAFDAMLKHEGEHAVLRKILGIKIDDSLIGGKGTVHMGIYTLEENDYKWHTNAELHELAGLGFELMSLDDTLLPPKLMSILTTTQLDTKSWGLDYGLAAFIVLYELVYMLKDRERQDFLRTLRAGGVDLGKVVNAVTRKKMRTIGERMVKLAHYLAQ